MIRLTLPMPPSTNRIWRVSSGRTHRSVDYTNFLMEATIVCRNAQLFSPTTNPVELTMHFYMARKNGDVSNRIKALEDALKGFAFVDDLQVVALHAFRLMDAKQPRVEVEVREVVA